MRESRLSGSLEGVMSDHDSYSDCSFRWSWSVCQEDARVVGSVNGLLVDQRLGLAFTAGPGLFPMTPEADVA
jgi:hypothetical protein